MDFKTEIELSGGNLHDTDCYHRVVSGREEVPRSLICFGAAIWITAIAIVYAVVIA